MQVLVTGHKGYIGAVMTPALIAAGHEVIGLDNGLFEQCALAPFTPDILSIDKDIRDTQPSDLEGLDAIIHLAGLCNDPLGNLNSEWTTAINHTASVRLAVMAKEKGISRFLFASSCSVYGSAGESMVDEETAPQPTTPYARSKLSVERDVAELADDEFSPTFLRCATAYGMSPSLRFDLVLNNLVAWSYASGQVYLKSDGRAWRPLVHVEDIACAFVAALDAPRSRVHKQILNLGITAENYRIRDLAEHIQAAVPDSTITYAPDHVSDQRSSQVNCDKLARTLPEFDPRWDVRRGAAQLYDEYKQIGLGVEDFEGPQYRRVRHVQHLLDTGYLDHTLRWNEDGHDC